MKLKNCVNCGAPLHGSVCEYCGTEYEENGSIQAHFERYDTYGTLKIGTREYTCYIGSVEATNICETAGRDNSGRLIRNPIAMKHKFTLIER
jgi:hypothetical protein